MTEAALSHVHRLMKNFWKLVHPLTSVGASSLCRGDLPVLCCQIQLLWLGRCLCLAWNATDGYGASGHQVSELKPQKTKKIHSWITAVDFVTSLSAGNLSNTHLGTLHSPESNLCCKIAKLRNGAFSCREIIVHIFIQINKKRVTLLLLSLNPHLVWAYWWGFEVYW